MVTSPILECDGKKSQTTDKQIQQHCIATHCKIYDPLAFHGREFMWTPDRGRRPCKTEVACHNRRSWIKITPCTKYVSTWQRQYIVKQKKISTIVTGPYEWKISMWTLNKIQLINRSINHLVTKVKNLSSYVLSFISHLLFIHRLVIQISSKEEFYQKRILLYCKISNFISQEQYSTCYMKLCTLRARHSIWSQNTRFGQNTSNLAAWVTLFLDVR